MRQGVENWEQRHRRWLAAGTLAGTVLFVVNANLIAARADERTAPVTVTTDKSAAKATSTDQTPLKPPAVQVQSSQTVNDVAPSRSSVTVQAGAVPLAAATVNRLASAVPTPRTSPDMTQAPAGQSPVAVTPVDPGVAPVNPHQLTHVMTAPTSQPLTHPKGQHEQLTYSHLVGGYNTDLRQVDRYDPQHQVPGQIAWQGETYANGIAQDAKGEDVHSELSYGDGSHPFYIDEWLPDMGLQIVLWQSSFAQKYTSYESFRQNFTKAQLASLVDFLRSRGFSRKMAMGRCQRCITRD
ncbi:hypothetical protein [Levilactobacillus zymae]|uniref:hypothetical protein n=1 Tax=Levilactobacillus zymae TaxID=267363 RepID=UPI0028B32596|nr:hypothetical protein [Levilactobacillus zymae]MDT6980189.1 hypothetical protein [Levilactobacillus zymae]